MIRLFSLLVVLVTFLLSSCEPNATFDQPQPAGSKAIAVFPADIRGKYLSTDSISFLTVSQNMIIRTYEMDEGVHKDSLGPGYKLVGDRLLNLGDSSEEKIKLRGDTVILHSHSVDTLFKISSDDVVKIYKGNYFLNKRYADSAWEVHKMDFQNGRLMIGDVSAEGDIDKLREITKSQSDSLQVPMPIHFRMSRKQFKAFVKRKGFSDRETFFKLKL